MKKIAFLLLALIAAINTQSCKDNNSNSTSITKEVKFNKEGSLQLKTAANDSIVASIDIEIAEGDYETQTGLMYRKGMEDNQGMLFLFDTETPRSFYMKNTEFSIDIIFINAKKEIVQIYDSAKPYDQSSLPSVSPCQYVLEVNAGLTSRWGIKAGDVVEWTRE